MEFLSDGSNKRGLLGLFACSRQLLQCKLYHFRGLGDRTTRMLKPSAWPAGIYLRAAWLGQVVTVSWILDTSLTKREKQIPKQELNLLMFVFFFETFCCFVRCAFCLTLKHASRGTWLVSDAGAIVEIEQSIMSQSVLNIVDHFLLLKFRQSKYGSSLRWCNMLITCLSFLLQPLQQTLTSLCAAHMQHFEATCMDGVRFKGKSYLGGSLFGGWHPTPCYYFHLLASPSGFFSRVIWTRGHSGKWMWLTLLDRDNVKIVKGSPFPSFSIFLYEMGGVGWVGPSHWFKTHMVPWHRKQRSLIF